MRLVYSLLLAIVVTAGSAYAGCGKKLTSEGALKSVDSKKKVIAVIDGAGEITKLSLTVNTKIMGAPNRKLVDLIGEKVTVISEHNKVDSVTLAKK